MENKLTLDNTMTINKTTNTIFAFMMIMLKI